MTAIHETAYPRLKPKPTPKELEKNYKPSVEEIYLLNKSTRRNNLITRLGFMVTLKTYQCLGYLMPTAKVPMSIKSYIAHALDIQLNLNESDDYAYDRSNARKSRHIEIVRDYIGVSADTEKQNKIRKESALLSAETKEDLADIINHILENLVKEKLEIPAYSRLLRTARAARYLVNNKIYTKIFDSLSETQKLQLDKLFERDESDDANALTLWSELKTEPKKPTANNIRIYMEYFKTMQEYKQQFSMDLDFISCAKQEHMYHEAMIYDAAFMRDSLKFDRRYALAVIFMNLRFSFALDDIGSVLMKWVRQLHAVAKAKLEKHKLEHQDEADELIEILSQVIDSYESGASAKQKLKDIGMNFGDDVSAVKSRCKLHLAFSGDNYFPFMVSIYENKRYLFFRMLDQITVSSATKDDYLIQCLDFIKHCHKSKKERVTLDYNDASGASRKLNVKPLSEKWFKFVTGKSNKDAEIENINRKHFELYAFSMLQGDLTCGDAFIHGAYEFDDSNKQLISWDEFFKEITEYCSLIKQSHIPSEFVQAQKNELLKIANETDNAYTDNEYLTIENGEPVIKKAKASNELKEAVKDISKQIADRMPLTNIVDIIIDSEKWSLISPIFKPLSGLETKITNYSSRFVATTFSYGCNIGPTQGARSLQQYNYKTISWVFNHHVTELRLNKAIEKIINVYNQFDLPKRWGDNSSMSVDGSHWDMYEQNLLSEYHIRYGSYGGMAYYHVADTYIALFSNFIPCGVYEAIYIFDGVEGNNSDIQPNQIHGDTGAQSEVVFGFALLLAIILMPRIRNLKHLSYYKPSKDEVFKHIEEIFKDQPIKWEIIETHYHDMLRIVMSIRKGHIKASTILKKLCSKSRKNKTYYAFRELGRVVRTKFLLKYIADVELRKFIHAATCKSEEFNNFIEWVSFGDGGVISDNLRFNQKKIIKYSHLLANMVILHVTANMTNVINDLKSEGKEVPDGLLKYLSPYRTEHINRLGYLALNMDKTTQELQYEIIN